MKAISSLVVFFLVRPIAAQCDTKCPEEWMTRTTSTLDSEPTLVDFFASDNATLAAVRETTAFFDRLGPRLHDVDERHDMPRTCTTAKSDRAVISATRVTAHRGLGCLEGCLWKVHHATRVESEKQSEAQRLFKHAKALSDATVAAGKKLNAASDLGFEFVTSPQFMRGSSDTKQCDMVKVSAQRLNDRWMLRSTIYDLENAYDSEKRGKTQYLQMMYLVGDDKLTYHRFNVSYCATARDASTLFYRPATAFVTRWETKPSWSDWRTRNISENPAIKQGIMDKVISAALFSEIDSASGVAIFLLPLVVAMAPAAVFNNIRNKRDLSLYIVLDVLAAVPLGLKSLEFLVDSRSARYFAESFYYGSQNYTGPAAAELFLAECSFVNWYRSLGMGLLATTCVLTMLCISLDIYFYRLLMRKKRDYISRIQDRIMHAGSGSEGPWTFDAHSLDEIIAELPGSDLRWFFSLEKKTKIEPEDNLKS